MLRWLDRPSSSAEPLLLCDFTPHQFGVSVDVSPVEIGYYGLDGGDEKSPGASLFSSETSLELTEVRHSDADYAERGGITVKIVDKDGVRHLKWFRTNVKCW